MKKILLVIMMCALMFTGICTVYASESGTEDEKEVHMILLMDTSASMNHHDSAREELQWARDISAVCLDTEIRLTVIGFSKSEVDGTHGLQVLANDEKIDSARFQSLSDSLDAVTREGQKTDQLEAITKAKELIDPAQAKNYVVVMLSDGELDYLGRTGDDKSEETEEEKNAKNEFRQICEELASNGCELFLVGFGTDVEMFQNWDEALNIHYLFEKKDLTKVIPAVFDGENADVSSEENTATDGTIDFAWEEKDKKIVVNLKSAQNNISEIEVLDENGEKQEVKRVDVQNSIYLFMTDLEQGEYQICTDTASNIQYSLMQIKQGTYVPLNITWKNADGEILDSENGYQLENSDFPLEVSVSAENEGEEESDIAEFGWFLRPSDGDEKSGRMSWDGKGTFEQSEVIPQPESSGKYKFGIYLKIKGETEEQRETFDMDYQGEDDTAVTDDMVEISSYVGEKINICKILCDISKEHQISFETSEIDIVLTEGDSDSFKKDDGSLCVSFDKKGTYQLQITKNGEEILVMKCNVTERSWWGKIVQWFRNHCPWNG